jgi:hypothetical protein
MKYLISVLLFTLSTLVFASESDKFYIEFKGTVKSFDSEFVEVTSEGGKTTFWIPKSTILGSIQSGKNITAVVSPSDLVKYKAELIRLNRSSTARK